MNIPYADLKKEYQALWREMVIIKSRVPSIDATIAKIQQRSNDYLAVEKATRVPWYVVAAFHNLEASLRFTTHLHNGDPLSARTVHVPKGRPVAGAPPFTWTASAIDALAYDGLTSQTNWTVQGIAFALERYNGWGYRRYHPHVKSPYLWSFSNHYAQGKYESDGKWSETLVSEQCGGMVLLKQMSGRGIVTLAEDPTDLPQVTVSAASGDAGASGGDLLALAERHLGERYVLGASANFRDPAYAGPWDCAEFASWVLYQAAGVVFGCTDDAAPVKLLEPYSGAWYDDAQKLGRVLEVNDAKAVPGAFFVRKPTKAKSGHVALSDGKGGTVEAMDTTHGVACGKVDGRFDLGVAVPGIRYA